MDLNLFNSRDVDIPARTNNNFVRSFISELQEHLNKRSRSPEDTQSLLLQDISMESSRNNFRNRSIEFGIDRFVGDFAVLENQENGRIIDVPIHRMPEDAKEGVILRFGNNAFTVDWEATERMHAKVRAIAERLERIPEFTIDRFESNYAVLENRNNSIIRNVSKHLIPEDAVVGDVLRFENNIYSIDRDAINELQTYSDKFH